MSLVRGRDRSARADIALDRVRQIRERRVIDERVERGRPHRLHAVRRKQIAECAEAEEVDEPLLLHVAEAEALHNPPGPESVRGAARAPSTASLLPIYPWSMTHRGGHLAH